MGYQVELSDQAVDDLGEIVCFLAEKSAEAAERIGHELLDTAFTLTLFPPPRRRRPAPPRNSQAGTPPLPDFLPNQRSRPNRGSGSYLGWTAKPG